MKIAASIRPLCGGALAVLAAAGLAACAGGIAYAPPKPSSGGGGGGGQNCIVAIAPANVQMVGINLFSPAQSACDDKTYQAVTGYFGGSTVTNSQVISVTHSGTDFIQFVNLDSQSPHTAADVGTWNGSYPNVSLNPAATPSPTGSDISAPGFTAGNINPGSKSRKYAANVPGMYIFGCAYHYQSNNMRTVIIVM